MLYFRKFVVGCDFIDEVLGESFWVNWEKSYGKNGKNRNLYLIVFQMCSKTGWKNSQKSCRIIWTNGNFVVTLHPLRRKTVFDI